MRHLTRTALARLVDETPTSAQAAHLAACPRCRAELAALTELVGRLRRLPPPSGAPAPWPTVRRRLRRASRRRGALRLAAGLAWFLLGAAAGRLLPGTPRTPVAPTPAPRPAPPPAPALPTPPPTELAARLAALEQMLAAGRAGLERAPADPVLNGFVLLADEERERALQQLARWAAAPWQ